MFHNYGELDAVNQQKDYYMLTELNFKLIEGDFRYDGSVIKYEGVEYYKTPGMALYVSKRGMILEIDHSLDMVFPKALYMMRSGYLRTYYNGRTITVQRLVALTFGLIDSLDAKLDIDHINGCRSDNRLVNLQAITHAENIKKRDANGSVHNRPIACYLDGVKIKDFGSSVEAAKWLIETGQTKSKNLNTLRVVICNAHGHKHGINTAYGYEWK